MDTTTRTEHLDRTARAAAAAITRWAETRAADDFNAWLRADEAWRLARIVALLPGADRELM